MSADEVLYSYLEKSKDEPAQFSIAANASPWRFYDGDFRIVPLEDLATTVKKGLSEKPEKKRVFLFSSWSAVAPAKGQPSLTERLSAAIGGIPVEGTDGFIWISPDGSWRTTRQAFTIKRGGRYRIAKGAELMISETIGQYLSAPIDKLKPEQSELAVRAGAAWDIYGFCPASALQAFELAAELGSTIGAYNAALMHLERNTRRDIAAARALLKKAAAAGDDKAKEKLRSVR